MHYLSPVKRATHRTTVVDRVEAECGSCGQLAQLSLTESRLARRPLDLLRSERDDRVDRWISCSHCERRYPAGRATAFLS